MEFWEICDIICEIADILHSGKGDAALKKSALALLAVIVLLLFSACTAEDPAGQTRPTIPADTSDHSAYREQEGKILYPGALQGIDVSEHQGEIDWQKVKADGIDFAILRVGYRGTGSAGRLMEDARFEENYAGAMEAGIPVGVYFYSQALSPEEAEQEADFVLELLDGRALQHPVFYDWEEAAGGRTQGASKSAVTDYAKSFGQSLREQGYETGTYFYASLGNRLYLSELLEGSLWLSELSAYPDVGYAVQYWQYSHSGRVDGIDTPVDRDLMYERGDR